MQGTLDGVAGTGQEIAVTQFAALRTPGGARGVDDRGEVIRRPSGHALIKLVVSDVGASRRDDADRVDRPDVLQIGQVAFDARNRGGVCVVLREDCAGP